jgi:hypothetical protein
MKVSDAVAIGIHGLQAWRTRRAGRSLDADWKTIGPQWRRRHL